MHPSCLPRSPRTPSTAPTTGALLKRQITLLLVGHRKSQGAVPVQWAGMASGLTSTTRFTGLLVAAAGLGAVLYYTVYR
jgi:hypothetical protein